MSDILGAITTKINALDKGAEVNAKICFGQAEIAIPWTVVGRALFRALLVETGRHEKDKIENQFQIFETAASKIK